MAIKVNAIPALLSWSNFTITNDKIEDPADGELVDAYTAFDYIFPNSAPVTKKGFLVVPENYTISLLPKAKVWKDVMQTEELLSHEQWHYDVGIITGRALCRQIATLKGTSLADLKLKLQAAIELHFNKRAGLLQKRYDTDTNHGTVERYQKLWKERMKATLADPKAETMGGYWL